MAVVEVLTKKTGLREAAQRYSIPSSTLHDKLKLIREGKEVVLKPTLGRFKNTFSPEYENILKSRVKDYADKSMPLTRKEFLKLAFDLAVDLKLPHRFNNEKRMAGKNFYYEFMKRHPDLSLSTAKSKEDSQLVVQDVTLNNGKKYKMLNGYTYGAPKVTRVGVRYRCTVGCSAYLYLTEQGQTIKVVNNHTHPVPRFYVSSSGYYIRT